MSEIVNLKEFIDVDLSETSEKTPAKTHKTCASFELVYHNNTDFIILKKTLKSNKYFVFLVSKNLYYVKSGRKITPFSKNLFYSFFKELKDCVPTNVHWLQSIVKSQNTATLLEKVVNSYEYSTILRYGIYVPPGCFDSDIKEIYVYVNDNPKLAGLTYEVYKQKVEEGLLNRYTGFLIDLLEFVFNLKDTYNFNIAKYFLEMYKDNNSIFTFSPLNGLNGIKEYIKFLHSNNINIKRFIEYLFQDLYEQGINDIDREIMYLYRDTINLQQNLYGEIKEKYPQYLKTYHDQLVLRYNIYKKHNAENIMLKRSKEYENLKYENGKYAIVIPQNTKEIIEEGIKQNHCVGSYVNRILDGETFIVFLRYKDTPNEPLVTVEIRDGCITQAKGKFNRPLSEEERQFLEQWAKIKNLNYEF